MKKTALCIGINDYPGTQADLRGCVNDASDWQQVFDRRGFQTRRLLDSQATKNRIIESMAKVVSDAGAGDLVAITYSGHGSWIPDTSGEEPDHRHHCLCPHDVAQNRPLADDEVFELLSRRAPGSRVLFVIDSCHSGASARFAPAPRAPGDTSPRVRFLPPETFLPSEQRALAARMGRAAPSHRLCSGTLSLSACLDGEFCFDAAFDGRGNGVLSHVALKVLGSLGGTATYRDWLQAIRESLPSSATPQTPHLHGSQTQKRWRLFE